ncbi:methylenetetrahydrofolate reductase [Nocardioides insulae]|uniref:methylenetetrahydrofolate reductase n=1 Tax=Nocardioides insulae TaxID=394734 RepID=UPI00040E7C4A|nr:methylenetetrahydrofolate reductase [Nocardioides insulae]
MRSRSRPSDAAARQQLREWLARPRYEVLPVAGVVEEIAAEVRAPATITVTVTAARGLGATLACAEQVTALGHRAIPHLAARHLHDEVEVAEVADRLVGSGIEEVFVVGGDLARPAGEYAGAADLLEVLTRVAPRLRVGVAGYPESHPRIPDEATAQALWDKRRRASYVVTQLCFDPAAVTDWAARVRRRGIDLPVLVGVPGAVSTGRLLRVGLRIGVGTSLRFLEDHSGLLRLAKPGAYDPEGLLAALAGSAAAADPVERVAGVHLYTFNAVADTERWRRDLLDRLEEAA